MFPVTLVADGLGSATSPAEIEAAVVSPLKLCPRDNIRHRATADLLVAVVQAAGVAGGSPEQRAAAAGIALNVLEHITASHVSGWGSRADAIRQSRELLLEAAIPAPKAEGASPEPSLSPELADVVARCLSVTLFSQWELHRAVFGGASAASLVIREVLEEHRVVDAPAMPPPLAEATLEA